MAELQLYMWHGTRARLLERHKFYVEQVRSRLLAQFIDIEGEADRYEEEVWTALKTMPSYGEHELSDLAESARDEAIGHYMQLTELRKQVLLGSIAGMFHQWDKDLRDFLDKELSHNVSREWIDKNLWPAKTTDIFDIFSQFGWDVRSHHFYALINACNIIVNVYKHGKGSSLKLLHQAYPKYLPDPLGAHGRRSWGGDLFLDYEWLRVSNDDFEEFAKAIEDFWKEMPERSYFKISS
jgi:hypothetical protein